MRTLPVRLALSTSAEMSLTRPSTGSATPGRRIVAGMPTAKRASDCSGASASRSIAPSTMMRNSASPEPLDDGAEPRRAVGDEACYRRPDLGAVEPHLQFLPLGGSRRLIGFGDAERIARRIELRLGDALPGDPRIERRAGDNLRPELLRALEVGRSLGERSLELADLALRLLDRRLGAKDGRVVLGEQGVELAAVETREHLSLLHRVAVVGENLDEPQAVERRADHRLIARDQSPGNEQALDEFTPLGRRDAHGRRRRNGRLGGRGGPCGAIRQRLRADPARALSRPGAHRAEARRSPSRPRRSQ